MENKFIENHELVFLILYYSVNFLTVRVSHILKIHDGESSYYHFSRFIIDHIYDTEEFYNLINEISIIESKLKLKGIKNKSPLSEWINEIEKRVSDIIQNV